MLVHIDGRTLGYAFVIPHTTSPYMSLNTFNLMFGRSLLWVPHEGKTIRILDGGHSLITGDYDFADERLWLRLTPALQDALGIQLQVASSDGLFFKTAR